MNNDQHGDIQARMVGAARSVSATLRNIRTHEQRRQSAMLTAIMVGLLFAWIHWLGLLVAGSLVGIVSRTWPRALLAGLGIGLLILLMQFAISPSMEIGELLALTPISYVTVGSGLLLPAWGSLVRLVV